MTRVILIRHGETEWNLLGKYQGQTDILLSEKGREQGRLLAKHFPFDKLDAIYASDLSRAVETADFVAKKFGLKVIPDIAFREMNFGDWEGLTYEEIVLKYPKGMNHFLTRPDILQVPNGETFPILQERAVKRLRELIKIHENETIAVAAHGGVIRCMLADALEMPLKNIWRIRQYNTAVSAVVYAENPTVEFINNTEHLRRD